jgi:hypothetical protein
VCGEDLFCLLGEEDGVGLCGGLPALADANEEEPNQSAEDANQIAEPSLVAAALTEDDGFDVFAFTVDADSRVVVATGGPLGCPGDTRIYRVDEETLAAQGIEAAIAANLSDNDDFQGSWCSLLVDDVDAGTHFYIITYFSPADFEYQAVFNSIPLVGDGERCDVTELENACGDELECVDPEGDNDGVCGGVDP